MRASILPVWILLQACGSDPASSSDTGTPSPEETADTAVETSDTGATSATGSTAATADTAAPITYGTSIDRCTPALALCTAAQTTADSFSYGGTKGAPHLTEETFEYNACGQVLIHDRPGLRLEYTYGAGDRLLLVEDYADSLGGQIKGEEAFTYTPEGWVDQVAWDGGTLAGGADGTVDVLSTYTYDATGFWTTLWFDVIATTRDTVTERVQDGTGRLAESTVTIDGDFYSREACSYPQPDQSVCLTHFLSPNGPFVRTTTTFNAAGQPLLLEESLFGLAQTTAYTYDAEGRLVASHHEQPDTGYGGHRVTDVDTVYTCP